MSRTETIKAGWLAALATSFVYCEISVVNASIFRNDGPLPWAVAFDLLCTLPAAYAWFVLRPAARPLLDLAPLLVMSIAGATILLRHVPALQLPLKIFAAAAELAVLSLLARRVVGALRQDSAAQRDFVAHAQQQRELWLRVLAFELCVFYYAFRRQPSARSVGTRSFDNHVAAQHVLLALALVTVMEAVPLHFLLQAWKPLVAWIVLALTLYSLCWIIGAYRALAARPHVLSAQRLLVRVGLFYTAEVERAAIRRALAYTVEAQRPDVVVLKFIAEPNVLLELSSPVRVYGPFGRTRSAARLAFYVERPEELIELHAEPRCEPEQQQ